MEETTGKISTIYAAGGFARSDLWVQILADVFDKKVLIADSHESSSFGAYILALYSLGIINKMDDALKMVSLTKEYKPSDTNHKVYEDMFKVFQGLYESIKQYF